MKKFVQIVEFATGKCVHQIDVTGNSDSHVERIERGVLRNLNTQSFYVEVVEREESKADDVK